MMVIDLLKIASIRHSYQELSKYLELSPPILSRYMRGHVLPSYRRARKLHEKLLKITNFREELKRLIVFNKQGFFDNTPIVSHITWLKLAANYSLEKFAGRRVTKVLTAAVDGIPIATMIASLLDVNIVIAKSTKEVGIEEFIEETYIPADSAVVMSLFLPKGLIKKKDSVLIVDDVVRTGETIRALVSLVKKSRADVSGIYVLVSVGDEWRKNLNDIISQYPVEVLVEL